MVKIISASVKNKSWQGANGIVTEGASISKNNDGVGFKGLHHAPPSLRLSIILKMHIAFSRLHPWPLTSFQKKTAQ